VYAFGAPRVGDARFVQKLASIAVYRIVHGGDIVCTVPPEALGFRHAGEEHRIGVAVPSPLQFDIPSLWNRLVTPVAPLADHAPVNYVDFV
jgi:hypothetical protein